MANQIIVRIYQPMPGSFSPTSTMEGFMVSFVVRIISWFGLGLGLGLGLVLGIYIKPFAR